MTAAVVEAPCERPALAWKLWLYTNYDCNLRCSYCLAKSSPNAPRKALGMNNVRRLIAAALDLGFAVFFVARGALAYARFRRMRSGA